jgi:hypothetical protein
MADLLQDITRQKTLLTKIQTSLKKISAPQESSAKRVSVLRKELPAAEKTIKDLRLDPVLLQGIQTELKKAHEELGQKEEELKTKFGMALANLLKPAGFILEGNYPRFKTSFYFLNVDIPADKVTLWLGSEIEELDVTKAIPETVVESLLKNHEALTKRPFDEKSFLRMLRTAYQMYLSASRKSEGNDASLPEIHALFCILMQKEKFRKNPVKENYTEYTRAMFSYDLSRLKTRTIDHSELRLITATIMDTRNKGDFFWVPSFEGTPAGTYSRMKFTGVMT